jgi:hypothetical protein
MEKLATSTIYAIIAIGAAPYAFYYRELGAWGCVATWGCMAIASWFWAAANGVDRRAKHASDMASVALIKGVSTESTMKGSELKKGALMSIASMCFGLIGVMMWVGTCSFGLAWAMMGAIPMVAIGYKSAMKLVRENHEKK